MTGMLSGLDLAEALASVPAECDRERARALFQIAESKFLAAFVRSQPKPEG